MDSNCDVCVIEDDPDDRRLILDILARQGYACQAANDGHAGWDLINQYRPKVVLSDWELPGEDGLQLCQRLRQSPELLATFFIMVTGRDDIEQREHALDSGVDDYLLKPVDRSYLLSRVRVGIRMWETKERLRQAAITDGLTELYNHDYLNSVIERELNRARRYGGRLSLIMLDLDFFKAVNDTYGHLVGNATLVEVARVLRQSVREFDTVGRFGGEEFAIVAPEASLEDAAAIAERIRLGIADTLHVKALRGHQVHASLGVASADDVRVRSAADLVDLADQALYGAKRTGRNRVVTALDLSDDNEIGIEAQEVDALRKRVAILSVQAKEVYIQTIASLLQALEEKDPFTARHSTNVSYYCEHIARAMGLSDALSTTVRNAGLLHDIGKVGVPDRILVKPTELTEAELAFMAKVPAISVRIIDHLRILESEIYIIRHQREYFDGSGFPDALRGEQIPIGSRIVLVANAFDAMTTDRVYRSCRSIDEAMNEIEGCALKQFDPNVIEGLATLIETQRNQIAERIEETAQALRTPINVFQ